MSSSLLAWLLCAELKTAPSPPPPPPPLARRLAAPLLLLVDPPCDQLAAASVCESLQSSVGSKSSEEEAQDGDDGAVDVERAPGGVEHAEPRGDDPADADAACIRLTQRSASGSSSCSPAAVAAICVCALN